MANLEPEVMEELIKVADLKITNGAGPKDTGKRRDYLGDQICCKFSARFIAKLFL